ncbi:MAG: 50S ribosomal protein L23 [Candidatus Wildermuthbacteria bacterium]|nr:50S ribosomal protein L23 [Candidatus Wildermuthbacteria bacterium]
MSALPFFKKNIEKKAAAPEKKQEPKISEAKKATVGLSSVGVIVSPHITEKAGVLEKKGEYIFNVYPRTNKQEIKNAVEKTYGVKVTKVNIINIPAKRKRVGKHMGHALAVRKAVVSLGKGYAIELMPR